MNNNDHIPVLLDECITLLNIKPNGIYVDCTFGRGGHTKAILSKLNSEGKLIAIDCDQTAIDYANEQISDQRFKIVKNNFMNLEAILKELNINKVDGFLFDLGVSSPQIDQAERGFSFHKDGKLDMRMDKTIEINAHKIVNTYSFEELLLIFNRYSDSKYNYNVAKKIILCREQKPINTTLELVEVIKSALPKKECFKQKHPAKVFFQAIRIAVNDEFKAIELGLSAALKYLKLNGRIVVISFHSLENKIVKEVLKENVNKKISISYLPINETNEFKIIKSLKVTEQEINNNYRSHSAKLNVIERINDKNEQ